MYLNTRGRYKRRRLVSFRRFLFWIVVPLMIIGGYSIYENRESYIPHITQFMQQFSVDVGETIATIQAPAPTPTTDSTTIIQRADLSWEQGLYQDAFNIYEQVIEAVPNQDYIHYRLTRGLLMQGRNAEAMIVSENAVTANPFSSNVWAIRSLALTRNGRAGEAIASALRALELQPTNTRARAFLAEAYYAAGQGTRALTELNRALDQDPNSYEAYYARGYLTPLVTFANFEQARDDLENAYDLSNGSIEIGVTLASEYIFRFNDADTGLALLQELVERNPENALVLYQLGRYYNRQIGDYGQAATYLNRCVVAVPNNINCNYELGRVLYAQNDYNAAADAFTTAVDLGTTDPYHWWWAGNLQLVLVNCAAALEFLNPGHELAKENNDTQLIGWYNDLISQAQSQCGIFVQPTLEPETPPES